MVFEGGSDWHEQIEYSEIYFEQHKRCRRAQEFGDMNAWAQALKGKISTASGILSKTPHKGKPNEFFERINQKQSNYIQSLNFNEMAGRVPLDRETFSHRQVLERELFLIEGELDTMVNSVMPFLNIRRDDDIKGM